MIERQMGSPIPIPFVGGEKCLEDFVRLPQADSAILDFHLDRSWTMNSGSYGQLSWTVDERVHRIEAVDAQIDQDLLDLDSIAQYLRQFRF